MLKSTPPKAHLSLLGFVLNYAFIIFIFFLNANIHNQKIQTTDSLSQKQGCVPIDILSVLNVC